MDFTIRYEARSGWALAWTIHGLLPFPVEGVPFKDAPRGAALNGQGTSTLERHGLVTVSHGVARLTSRGLACRASYGPNVERVEAEWSEMFDIEALREALGAVDEPQRADHPVLRWFGTLQEVSG